MPFNGGSLYSNKPSGARALTLQPALIPLQTGRYAQLQVERIVLDDPRENMGNRRSIVDSNIDRQQTGRSK